jgi:hypothetical protein
MVICGTSVIDYPGDILLVGSHAIIVALLFIVSPDLAVQLT